MNLGEVLSSTGSVTNYNSTLKSDPNKNKSGSFADVLKETMNDINTQQVEAYDAMESIATGKVENLQEAVQQIEEAELSLKLGLEVKNKALNAYKQIMSMQI